MDPITLGIAALAVAGMALLEGCDKAYKDPGPDCNPGDFSEDNYIDVGFHTDPSKDQCYTLQGALDALDPHNTYNNATIRLLGGQNILGTATADQDWEKLTIQSYPEDDSLAELVPLYRDDTGAILTVDGDSNVTLDRVDFEGTGVQDGLTVTDGANVTSSGCTFNDVATGVDIESGTYRESYNRYYEVHDRGIYAGLDSTVSVDFVRMGAGLIPAAPTSMIEADGATDIQIRGANIMDVHTSGPTVSLKADYLVFLGASILNVESNDYLVKIDSGEGQGSELQQYSYLASWILANNSYGPDGILQINSAGQLQAHNLDILYNTPLTGTATTVVDLRDTVYPAGRTSLHQSNIVGNYSTDEPVLRNYDTNGEHDEGQDSVEYNNIYDNGPTDYTDTEDSNYSMDPGFDPTVMYDPETCSVEVDAFDLPSDSPLIHGGDSNSQYPDFDDETTQQGSITARGGPVGYYIDTKGSSRAQIADEDDQKSVVQNEVDNICTE